MLIDNHEKYIKQMKLNYYSQGNKAGKLLANQLRQNKINKLIHHRSSKAIYNPKEIADSFSDYESLYNLKEDQNTPQPTPQNIAI